MKNINHLLVFFLATVVGLGINSCTDDFEEINTDPLALTADKVDGSLIGLAFSQTQYATMNGLHWRFQISQNLFSDLYSQYFATTAANFDSDLNVQVGRWSDLCWTSFYGQAAPNIKFVEDFTMSEGNEDPVGNAAAKIWRVMGYHRITDYYGPVPYFEFGNAELSVPYDSQEAIYRDFFTTLDEAVAVLKANPDGSAFGSNDLIFGGNVASWLTFANTLRLRLAMRVRFVDPGLAKAEAEKAVADGVMESNDQNATVLTNDVSQNPITTITNWGEYRMSATMESVLKGYDDPRTKHLFSPAANGDSPDDPDNFPYEGLQNGQSKVAKGSDLNNPHSDVGPTFLPTGKGGTNPRIVVIRAAEAWFLRAEGAELGWNMGVSTEEAYNNGIEASMIEWGEGGAAAAYINSTAVPAAPSTSLGPVADVPIKFDAGRALEQIGTQKWIALYPDGWEAWAELRRTGFPKTYARLGSENPDVAANETMRKMTYVSSEFDNNGPAVDAAIQLGENGGQDNGSIRVWWDPN
jgi:hypothetical protein